MSQRKLSSTMIVFTACVLGLGIGLFGINYWHATKCSSDKSPQEMEEMIAALSRRLLQSESLVHKNEILVNKVIKTMEANLFKLEKKEYEELSQHSKDEAVRIALFLASHPAPTFPEFPLDAQYASMEKIADLVDDIYSAVKDDDKLSGNRAKLEYEGEELVKFEEEKEKVIVTDAEATKLCIEWKEKYHVIAGVSWGDLPYDLQQKWLEYSCDYHMRDESKGSEVPPTGS
jgi:hypothetical protein